MKQYYPGDEKPSEEPTLYAKLEQKEQEEDNDTLDTQEKIKDNVTNRSLLYIYLHGQPKTQEKLQPLLSPISTMKIRHKMMMVEVSFMTENEHEGQAVT